MMEYLICGTSTEGGLRLRCERSSGWHNETIADSRSRAKSGRRATVLTERLRRRYRELGKDNIRWRSWLGRWSRHTIIPSNKRVPITVKYPTINVFLRLFQRDVHVSIETR